MARCDACTLEMTTADGCTFDKLRFTPFKKGTRVRDRQRKDYAHSQVFDRIKYGEGNRWHDTPRCHDCGVRVGQHHHPGCDHEECPRCHRQLIGCFCSDEGTFTDLGTMAPAQEGKQ